MKTQLKKLTIEDITYIIQSLSESDELDDFINRHKVTHAALPDWLAESIKNNHCELYSVNLHDQNIGVIGLVDIEIDRGEGELFIWFDNQTIVSYHRLLKQWILEIMNRAVNRYCLSSLRLTIHKEKLLLQEIAERLGGQSEDYSATNYLHYRINTNIFHQKHDISLNYMTDIHYLEAINDNQIYIKRDDLIPFSFGGNKARKAYYFFEEILTNDYKVVVTYGSLKSNHCRVVANMCANHHIECIIISPQTNDTTNLNQQLIQLSGAKVITCDLAKVSETIQQTLTALKQEQNKKAYFIPGGGHGNHGTQAYIDAYEEIASWQVHHHLQFDYIFLASGTGTTQAGLILGQLLYQNDKATIIGISIARVADYGTRVIQDSMEDYIRTYNIDVPYPIEEYIHFYDQYVTADYGQSNPQIMNTVHELYNRHSVAMSTTYTAKAYTGMKKYIAQHQLENKHILFLHTGGIPLFFEDLLNA